MLPAGRTPAEQVAIAPVYVAPLHSCLAHIVRKFKESRDDNPRITARILLLIGSVYQIEKRLRNERAGPLERHEPGG